MKPIAKSLAVILTAGMLCLGLYEIFLKNQDEPTDSLALGSTVYPSSVAPKVQMDAVIKEDHAAPDLTPVEEEKVYSVSLLGDSYFANVEVFPLKPSDQLSNQSTDNLGRSAWLSKFGMKGDNFTQMFLRYKKFVMPLKPDLTVFMIKRKDIASLAHQASTNRMGERESNELTYQYSEQNYYQNEEALGANEFYDHPAFKVVSNATQFVGKYEQWEFLMKQFSSLFFSKANPYRSGNVKPLIDKSDSHAMAMLRQLADQHIMLVGIESFHEKDVELVQSLGINFMVLGQEGRHDPSSQSPSVYSPPSARKGTFQLTKNQRMGKELSSLVHTYLQQK